LNKESELCTLFNVEMTIFLHNELVRKNYIINGENSGPYCSCGLTRKKLKKNQM